jgi:hypothetical protein
VQGGPAGAWGCPQQEKTTGVTKAVADRLRIYYDQDADLNLLKGKKVAVIGYGSQT